MRRLSTTTIGMMAWSKRVCVLLVVSLLFDLSVCLCRPTSPRAWADTLLEHTPCVLVENRMAQASIASHCPSIRSDLSGRLANSGLTARRGERHDYLQECRRCQIRPASH